MTPDERPRKRQHRSHEVEEWVRNNPGRPFAIAEVATALDHNHGSVGTILRRMLERNPTRMVCIQRGIYQWNPNPVALPPTPTAPPAPEAVSVDPPARPGRKPGVPQAPAGRSFTVTPITVRDDGSMLVRNRDNELFTLKPFKF